MLFKVILLCLAFGVFECYGALKIKYYKPQKSCSCGLNFGSPMIQQLTKRMHYISGGYWYAREYRHLFVDKYNGSIASYNPIDGSLSWYKVKELANQQIISIYPTYKPIEGRYFIVANQSLYFIKMHLKNQTYTLRKEMDIVGKEHLIQNSALHLDGQSLILTAKPSDRKDRDKGKGLLIAVNITGKTKKQLDSGYNVPNGLAFNLYYNKLFVSDTKSNKIYKYEYTGGSSIVSQKQLVLDMKNIPYVSGNVSVLTKDREGRLYIGLRHSMQILVFDANIGVIVQHIPVTSPMVTSLAWGFPQYRTLYVGTTYAALDLTKQTSSGRLLAISGLASRGWRQRTVHYPLNKQ